MALHGGKVSCTHMALYLCSTCFCVAISNIIFCVDGTD